MNFKRKVLSGLLTLATCLAGSPAHAAFNLFQCTSISIRITKPMAYKDGIEIEDLKTGHVEQLNLESDASLQYGPRGDIETFVFRRWIDGRSDLYSLVVTENSKQATEATAILYRLNATGTTNPVLEKGMKCKIQ